MVRSTRHEHYHHSHDYQTQLAWFPESDNCCGPEVGSQRKTSKEKSRHNNLKENKQN